MKSTALKLSLIPLLMFAFSFAQVPIYDVFVDIIGLNSKAWRTEASSFEANKIDTSRTIEVRFLASTNAGLPWSFKPAVTKMEVHPGKLYEAIYRVRNTADKPTTGQAVPSVSPGLAAQHFNKTECFCFTQQELAGFESRDMPLRFIIDSAISEDIQQITLSYTFFSVDKS
ncbi:MAG: cytochrome c oxidase assembly protein [Gammaproteobacteria bacterium]|nr:cytochrome c oxidase assembly protein [Gammaproteobacteria bacterium]